MMVRLPIALDIPGIITALRGNGGRLVRGAVELLLLRDEIAGGYPRERLTAIAWELVAGKPKLEARVRARYATARLRKIRDKRGLL